MFLIDAINPNVERKSKLFSDATVKGREVGSVQKKTVQKTRKIVPLINNFFCYCC